MVQRPQRGGAAAPGPTGLGPLRMLYQFPFWEHLSCVGGLSGDL